MTNPIGRPDYSNDIKRKASPCQVPGAKSYLPESPKDTVDIDSGTEPSKFPSKEQIKIKTSSYAENAAQIEEAASEPENSEEPEEAEEQKQQPDNHDKECVRKFGYISSSLADKKTARFHKKDEDKPWKNVKDTEWTGADKLHEQGLTGKGQTVAFLDTGYNHPDKPLKGWKDMVANSPVPVDLDGHGTLVAGNIAKMAPDADLVAVRVFGPDDQTSFDNITNGINWVIDNKDKLGISVLNLSLTMPPDRQAYGENVINQAVEKAVDNGIIVVTGAGNSGPVPLDGVVQEFPTGMSMGAPADDPNAITVGAALDPQHVSDFSSRGPTEDFLNKPDLIAPGEFIVSWAVPGSTLEKVAKLVEKMRKMDGGHLRKLIKAKPQIKKVFQYPENILDKNDKELEKFISNHLPDFYRPTKDTIALPGTSFSTPIASGIIADLKQAKPGATAEEVKEALKNTADKIEDKGYSLWDQGAGFVRGDKAKDYLVDKK